MLIRVKKGKLKEIIKSKSLIPRLQIFICFVRFSKKCKSIFICFSYALLGLHSTSTALDLTMKLSTSLRCVDNPLHITKPSQRVSTQLVDNGTTLNRSLDFWFPILSILVSPHIHLSIHISITSLLCYGRHFISYNNVGLIATQ